MILQNNKNIKAINHNGKAISKVIRNGEELFGGGAAPIDITPELTEVGFIVSDGFNQGTGDYNWLRSGYLVSESGYIYDINAYSHPIINTISFYDSNYNFISGQLGGSDTGVPDVFRIVAPANTAYIRICAANVVTNPHKPSSFIQYS